MVIVMVIIGHVHCSLPLSLFGEATKDVLRLSISITITITVSITTITTITTVRTITTVTITISKQ